MTKEERTEYMRRYTAEHREKIRERKRENYWLKKGQACPETRVCASCGRKLPVYDFVDSIGRMSNVVDCRDCRSIDRKASNRQEYMRKYMRDYRKTKRRNER